MGIEMNWYKTSQTKTIEQITQEVRKEFVDYHDDEVLRAICLDASRKLRDVLIQNGYKATVVQGTFAVDDPNYEYAPDDLEDEDEDKQEEIMRNPLHYWVEVNGLVVDITASQFNDELEEPVEPIQIGSYAELGRYNPIHRGWK
jgi:cobalamin biosynthesis Co2+ chelatase CbiK